MQRFLMKLEGPLTVAFSKLGDGYVCNALEFDIVGTGQTENEALQQLHDLMRGYLKKVVSLLASGNKVRFFNPADEDDWNSADQRVSYDVVFKVNVVAGRLPDARQFIDPQHIEEIAKFSDSIEDVELVPA